MKVSRGFKLNKEYSEMITCTKDLEDILYWCHKIKKMEGVDLNDELKRTYIELYKARKDL